MTKFHLQELRPDATDPAFIAWSKITLVCEQAIFGSGHTAYSAQERAAAIELDVTVSVTPLLARLGDEPVGAGVLELSLLDNLHFASLEVCIAPKFRRRGYGTKLLLELITMARDAGRTTLNVHHTWPLGLPNPAEGFAAAHGFSSALTEYRSDLLLPAGSLDPLLLPLERAASAPAANYDVLSWADELPPQWAEPRAQLAARMVLDAPLGELDIGAEAWDAQRVQQLYRVAQAQGRRVLESIAVHRPSGQAVGYTMLVVGQQQVAFQWDTLVLKDHRGHRLGQLLKAANLRALAANCPQVRRVVTWNALENTPMLRVNQALGFTSVGVGTEWQRVWPAG